MIYSLYQKVRYGRSLEKDELMILAQQPIFELCQAADHLRRQICGEEFDFCTIINGKSGRCSEDCKFCAQAACYGSGIGEYPLLTKEQIMEEADDSAQKGVLRFSVVTSGKRLTEREVELLCEAYRRISGKGNISLCASHGLLCENQFFQLKKAGVRRYHNNLETSEAFFPTICTTHSFHDKVCAIRAARKAGLEVCSGGIIGMGETMEDRIDMALALRHLGIQSIPLNILHAIPGTPLENQKPLSLNEIKRTVAVFRFALPEATIRLAGGRGKLPDKGESAFRSGANAAITGDMLTTDGIRIDTDFAMIQKLGFEVRKK